MTWKLWLLPLLRRLQKGFLALANMDGKPALSVRDFQLTVERVIAVQKSFAGASGAVKAKAVGAWMLNEFSAVIDEYFIPALVTRAYDYAEAKGILPKSK